MNNLSRFFVVSYYHECKSSQTEQKRVKLPYIFQHSTLKLAGLKTIHLSENDGVH